MKMKKSKFVGKMFDNGWVCTGCNLAANYGHGTKHNQYWYAFERKTSDGKFDKWIRIEGYMATKIWNGTRTVESISLRREKESSGIHKINYNFIGRK